MFVLTYHILAHFFTNVLCFFRENGKTCKIRCNHTPFGVKRDATEATVARYSMFVKSATSNRGAFAMI